MTTEIQKLINETVSEWNGIWYIHDWYHSFDELYEHRILLFLNLCKIISEWWCATIHWDNIRWSDTNSDWSKRDWWFVLWISDCITYHLPNKYLRAVKRFKRLDKWKRDWHNSVDVVERLNKLLLNELILL